MKKFFKWVGILVGAFIALGIVMAIVGGNGDDTATTPTTETPKAEQTAKPKVEKPKVDTKAVFDAIKVGDTLTGKGGDDYNTVIAKLGKPDSETESTSGDMKMVMCDWFSLTEGNYSVTFINGHVANKAFTK